MNRSRLRVAAATAATGLVASGCGFSVYDLPLPGGADTGDDPYSVSIEFRDVLDLVPQSSVKVNDVSVGRVTEISLDGWTAQVTVELNGDVSLPDNAVAELRQTSLLGEKFVSLAPPPDAAPQGELGEHDVIPLERSGRNPEVEEVLGALSLLLNGGGIEQMQTIMSELNQAFEGREPQVRAMLENLSTFTGQLDRNKAGIITALRRVNGLALSVSAQREAILEALDTLPAALSSVNRQRDDLVRMLRALSRLSDVGTRVIRESKVDTLRNLRALAPILSNLSDAGDDFPESLSTLLMYPFTDAVVGPTPVEARNLHMGDYSNLSVQLDLNLLELLQGGGGPPDICEELPDTPLPDCDDLPDVPPEVCEAFPQLCEVLPVPGVGGGDVRDKHDNGGKGGGGGKGVGGGGPLPDLPDVPGLPGGGSGGGGGGGGGGDLPVCDLLGLCRPGFGPGATVNTPVIPQSSVAYDPDVARLLLGAVVR